MEFWGLEVRSGERVNMKIPEGRCLVIRQACLAASTGGVEECVIVLAGQKKEELVLGILHTKKQTQQQVNKLFGKDITLYHSCKKGSVYLVGNLIAAKNGLPLCDVEEEIKKSDVDEEQMAPKEEEIKNGCSRQRQRNSLDDVDEEQETPNSPFHLDEIPDDFDDTKKNEKFVRDLDKFLKILDEEEDTSEEEELENGGGCMLYNRTFETKTLLGITVGAVCVAASWVMMHPRK